MKLPCQKAFKLNDKENLCSDGQPWAANGHDRRLVLLVTDNNLQQFCVRFVLVLRYLAVQDKGCTGVALHRLGSY